MAIAEAEDREAFRDARQSKMLTSAPDERGFYQGENRKTGIGTGNGNQIRIRDGSGSGSMHRYQNHGSSGGNRMGAGGQHRGGGKR